METFKVYKHETVISAAEVEASSQEQALRYARVTVGMPTEPQYVEVERRNPRLSMSAERPKEAKEAKEPEADAPLGATGGAFDKIIPKK